MFSYQLTYQQINYKPNSNLFIFTLHRNYFTAMKQVLDTAQIRSKFQMLISMDEDAREKLMQSKTSTPANVPGAFSNSKPKPPQIPTKQVQKEEDKQSNENRFKEVIYTKGDIAKEISKLKPYLESQKQELTTVQLENLESKKMSAQQKKSLSNVIIYLNKRLCQKLRQQASVQKQFHSDRVKLQRQGWTYEVFYRISQNPKAQLSTTPFKSGYALLTTILQLYQNLTFSSRIMKLNVSEIKRVKYTSEKQYQIIDIRHDGGTLQLGFLNETKLQLFDRMLFLLKNMARTSTNRLFQNQLIKSLYAEY